MNFVLNIGNYCLHFMDHFKHQYLIVEILTFQSKPSIKMVQVNGAEQKKYIIQITFFVVDRKMGKKCLYSQSLR